jgi:thiamine-phosphate pyrophosphorylase
VIRVLDPTLYLVADGGACGERGVVATVAAAVAGGVTAVQLRDHRATTRELVDTASELRDLLAGTGVCLLVNDRLDVALAAGADGVHVGQSDLPVEAARAIAGALPPGTADYLGVGPIFPTPTKADATPPMGVDGLRAACDLSRLPCVAIGGITADRTGSLFAAGAAGVAVVAAICGATDPRGAAAELRQRCGR